MVTLDGAGREAERVWIGVPAEPLRHLAELIWVDPRPGELGNRRPAWRIVPDGAGHLIVHAGPDGSFRPPRLVGPRTRWVDLDRAGRTCTLGVRLEPGAVGLLAGRAAHELADRSVPLAELGGAAGDRGADVAARIRDADSPAQVFGALHAWLLGRVRTEGRELDWRVRGTGRRLGALGRRGGVRAVAAELGLSPRSLRSTLRREVGLSPKAWARVWRLHGTLEGVLSGEALSWSSAAHRYGFYDQAHLVREFRDLLGEPPTDFLARRSG